MSSRAKPAGAKRHPAESRDPLKSTNHVCCLSRPKCRGHENAHVHTIKTHPNPLPTPNHAALILFRGFLHALAPLAWSK